jgi:hypothetical protein
VKIDDRRTTKGEIADFLFILITPRKFIDLSEHYTKKQPFLEG